MTLDKKTDPEHPKKRAKSKQTPTKKAEVKEEGEEAPPNKKIAGLPPPPGASLLLLATVGEASEWVAQFQTELNEQLEQHTLCRTNFSQPQPMPLLDGANMNLPNLPALPTFPSDCPDPSSTPNYSFSAASQLSTILNASLSQSLLSQSLAMQQSPLSAPFLSTTLAPPSDLIGSPSIANQEITSPSPTNSSSADSPSLPAADLEPAPNPVHTNVANPHPNTPNSNLNVNSPPPAHSTNPASPTRPTSPATNPANPPTPVAPALEAGLAPEQQPPAPELTAMLPGMFFPPPSSEWLNPLLTASFSEELARLVAEEGGEGGHPPPIISWEDDIYPVEVDDIVGRRSKLPKRAVVSLQRWFDENMYRPYPSDCSKHQLAYETGLTAVQLNHWFTNTRKRYWLPQVKQLQDNGVALTKEASAFVVMPWHDHHRKASLPLLLS